MASKSIYGFDYNQREREAEAAANAFKLPVLPAVPRSSEETPSGTNDGKAAGDKRGVVTAGTDSPTNRQNDGKSPAASQRPTKAESVALGMSVEMTPQQKMDYDRLIRRNEIRQRNEAEAEKRRSEFDRIMKASESRYEKSRQDMAAQRKAWKDGTDFTGMKSIDVPTWVGWGAGSNGPYQGDEMGVKYIQDWAKDFAGQVGGKIPKDLIKDDGSVDFGKVKTEKQFNALMSMAKADRDDLAERQARVDKRLAQLVAQGKAGDARSENVNYLAGKGVKVYDPKTGRSTMTTAQIATTAANLRRRDLEDALAGFESSKKTEKDLVSLGFGGLFQTKSDKTLIDAGRAAGLTASQMADDSGNIDPTRIRAALADLGMQEAARKAKRQVKPAVRRNKVPESVSAPVSQVPAASTVLTEAPTIQTPVVQKPDTQAPAAQSPEDNAGTPNNSAFLQALAGGYGNLMEDNLPGFQAGPRAAARRRRIESFNKDAVERAKRRGLK